MFTMSKTYRGSLGLQGVIEHFTDDICEWLDCNVTDSKFGGCSPHIYEEELTMENGIKLRIEGYFEEQQDEWVCYCEQIN